MKSEKKNLPQQVFTKQYLLKKQFFRDTSRNVRYNMQGLYLNDVSP